MSPSLAPGAGAPIFPSSELRYWFSGQTHHLGQAESMEFRLHILARHGLFAQFVSVVPSICATPAEYTVEQWREHVLCTYPSVAQAYSRPARYLQRKKKLLKVLLITMVCVYSNVEGQFSYFSVSCSFPTCNHEFSSTLLHSWQIPKCTAGSPEA